MNKRISATTVPYRKAGAILTKLFAYIVIAGILTLLFANANLTYAESNSPKQQSLSQYIDTQSTATQHTSSQSQIPTGGWSWLIASYYVDVDIRKDNSARIHEKIEAIFNEPKHGIYRDIPMVVHNRSDNVTIRTPIKDVNVTDENGNRLTVSKSSVGDFLRIKIGDADITMTGQHTYNIDYTVYNVVWDDGESRVFYWDVIGDGFDTVINTATVDMHFPVPVDTSKPPVCQAGHVRFEDGDDSQNYGCEFEPYTANATDLRVYATEPLGAYNGLTVKVTLFPGGIAGAKIVDRSGELLARFAGIIGTVVAGASLLYFMWLKAGRDERGKTTVVPQFEPPEDLSLFEAEMLLHKISSMSIKSITATIVKLAINGVLVIRENETRGLLGKKREYSLILVNPNKDSVLEDEQVLLSKIFEDVDLLNYKENDKATVSITSSNPILQQSDMKVLKSLASDSLVRKKFYAPGALGMHTGQILLTFAGFTFAGIGIFVARGPISYIFGSFVFNHPYIYNALLGMMYASIPTSFWFSVAIPFFRKRLRRGSEMLAKLKGLKMYMEMAEEDRIKMMQSADSRYLDIDDEGKVHLYESLLPYAMLFGIETTWSAQFADIYGADGPSWYASSGDTFSTMYLAESLSGSLNQAVSSSIPAPSSGGSSFGGGSGGGGGGGGGSW